MSVAFIRRANLSSVPYIPEKVIFVKLLEFDLYRNVNEFLQLEYKRGGLL